MPFRIRAGTDIESAEYADGCVVTMPTRAFEFSYPLRTRSAANIPATCWTAGRCWPIDFLQERYLTKR
jgi:hypothetical protein